MAMGLLHDLQQQEGIALALPYDMHAGRHKAHSALYRGSQARVQSLRALGSALRWLAIGAFRAAHARTQTQGWHTSTHMRQTRASQSLAACAHPLPVPESAQRDRPSAHGLLSRAVSPCVLAGHRRAAPWARVTAAC